MAWLSGDGLEPAGNYRNLLHKVDSFNRLMDEMNAATLQSVVSFENEGQRTTRRGSPQPVWKSWREKEKSAKGERLSRSRKQREKTPQKRYMRCCADVISVLTLIATCAKQAQTSERASTRRGKEKHNLCHQGLQVEQATFCVPLVVHDVAYPALLHRQSLGWRRMHVTINCQIC